MKKFLLFSSAIILVLFNCSNEAAAPTSTSQKSSSPDFDKEQFDSHWNQGKAEISSYKLSAARYGEMREGEAVLIYVTEPFSKSKQVKLDYADKAGDDKIDVLKLNQSMKFNTGLYPYSIMTSTFTPYKSSGMENTLKSSMSMQEWCGHVFVQSNKDSGSGGYKVDLKSYFESEGDEVTNVSGGILEEEYWSQIRIDPKELKTGEVMIIPSAVANRFQHIETKARKAKVSMVSINEKEDQLEIAYTDLKRNLKIRYNKAFPYEIQSWEETYESGFGANRKTLTSTGELMERQMLDYWNKNKNSDAYLRGELGLK